MFELARLDQLGLSCVQLVERGLQVAVARLQAVDGVGVRLVEPLAQHAGQLVTQRRITVKQRIEVLPAHKEDFAVAACPRAGHPPALGAQQAHLADVFSGTAHRDDLLAAVFEPLENLDLALDNDEEDVPSLSLREEHGPIQQILRLERVSEPSNVPHGQRGEERDSADDLL